MRPIRTLIVLSICIVALLPACAARKSLVVLLPDPDGKAGTIELSNKGGSQIISEAQKASEVRSFDAVPEAPVAMEESKIREIFGDALAAQPPAPEHYLIYFESNTSELTPESLKTLEDIFAGLKRIKPVEVSIVGHTDRVGTGESNFRLGLERANLMKSILISKGIDAGVIEITSHGEDNPLIKTEDEVAEPRNRRVEIIMR